MKNNYTVILNSEGYNVFPKEEVARMVEDEEISIDDVFFDLKLKEESREAIERIETVLNEEVLNGGTVKKENELLLSPEEDFVYLLQVLENLNGQYQGTCSIQEKRATLKKINKVSKKLYKSTEIFNLV